MNWTGRPTAGSWRSGARSRALGAGEDRAAALRAAEVEASYRSAERLGFDEMVEPAEARNAVLATLRRALSRRQAPAEPLMRPAVTP